MKRSFLLTLFLAALLLVSCSPSTVSTLVAVPPLEPTTGSQVVTMQPEAPATLPPAEPLVMETPTTPAATAAPEEEPANAPWISYLGDDGNVWLLNPASGEMRQVTQDGTPMNNAGSGDTVFYGEPQWSSDGQLLAMERQHGAPVDSGMSYTFSLVVYDLASQTSRTLLEGQQAAGFDWQPGTHRIAFGQSVDSAYFATRGGVDPSWARGINVVNADSGEISALVQPERGLHLVAPVFSPDGSKVAFQEVYLMEGNGKFAYYDLATQTYTAWDTPIGGFQWTSDGLNLVYDDLTYAPSGTESIFWNTMYGDQLERLLPENAPNTYAYGPALSPDGSQIAFVQEQLLEGGITSAQVMVMPLVVPASGSEPRALGVFEQPGDLHWSADGRSILLGAGPWFDGRQFGLLSAADGSFRPLASGTFANWQPVP